MKYFIITYGCQMNISDSERLAAKFKRAGYQPAAKAANADIVALNACSVRQSATDRIYGQIEKHKNKKIIIAGCLLAADKKKIKEKYGQQVSFWHPDEYFNPSAGGLPISENNFRAYVPIMTGCDNFCSYCVVPYTRGREKSRPADEIIAEVKRLIKNDYKEIVLLGQNVNSYQSKLSSSHQLKERLRRGDVKNKINTSPSPSSSEEGRKNENFASLLCQINALPGNFRLSFLTSHPKDMSEELIKTIAQCAKISPYLHLPVQAGDDKILKAMNRRYTAAHYKKLIKKLRAAFKKQRPAFPPLAVSTDIIVGFPGETKKQFQNTAKLMKEIKFDMAYLARYSPRSGTIAARLPDNISSAEKKHREFILNEILKKTALANNKKYIGQTVDVLIEEIKKCPLPRNRSADSPLCKRRAKRNLIAFGKTATNKTVKTSHTTEHESIYPGQIIRAKIIAATAWGLKGSAIKNE